MEYFWMKQKSSGFRRLQSTLRMIRIDDPSLSPDILDRLRAGDGSRSDIIQPLEDNLIGGYTLVRDINGQDAFVLELVPPGTFTNRD